MISPMWVLTAAHCVGRDSTPSMYSVAVFRHNIALDAATDDDCAEDLSVAAINCHPDYHNVTQYADICILQASPAIM